MQKISKKISVAYPPFADLTADIKKDITIHVIQPKQEHNRCTKEQEIRFIEESLEHPLNCSSFPEYIRKKITLSKVSKKNTKDFSVLIIIDDHTRVTPVKLIIPVIFKHLSQQGIDRRQILLLIAGGSHRFMASEELTAKFGEEIVQSYQIIQHNWNDPSELKHCGTINKDVEVLVNKRIFESDLVIALGNIVPHEIAGFSGGYKILFPGLSNLETVQKIHWLSTSTPIDKRLGALKNPIRALIDECGRKTNVDFIINTVLDLGGNIVKVFSGDPLLVQADGAKNALNIYGVHVKPTEIIVTDCVPEKSDLWTSAKAILHTKNFVKKGGIMICCAACPEGVCPSHPQILEMGYKSPEQLEKEFLSRLDLNGNPLYNRLSATHCANIWEIQQHCTIFLVTRGIAKKEAEFLGFEYFTSLQSALDEALKRFPKSTEMNLIHRGSEILNLYENNGVI